MSFYQEIKSWLIRTFIVLISLLFFITPSISFSANLIGYEHEYRSYSSIDLKNVEETNSSTNQNLVAAVNGLQFTCKSESDLVDYRNWATSTERNATKGGSQGGLNLFKWGAEQTGKSTGWKAGDYMLHLPNKGTPALNWKANYGALRSEMNLGNLIILMLQSRG